MKFSYVIYLFVVRTGETLKKGGIKGVDFLSKVLSILLTWYTSQLRKTPLSYGFPFPRSSLSEVLHSPGFSFRIPVFLVLIKWSFPTISGPQLKWFKIDLMLGEGCFRRHRYRRLFLILTKTSGRICKIFLM